MGMFCSVTHESIHMHFEFRVPRTGMIAANSVSILRPWDETRISVLSPIPVTKQERSLLRFTSRRRSWWWMTRSFLFRMKQHRRIVRIGSTGNLMCLLRPCYHTVLFTQTSTFIYHTPKSCNKLNAYTPSSHSWSPLTQAHGVTYCDLITLVTLTTQYQPPLLIRLQIWCYSVHQSFANQNCDLPCFGSICDCTQYAEYLG